MRCTCCEPSCGAKCDDGTGREPAAAKAPQRKLKVAARSSDREVAHEARVQLLQPSVQHRSVTNDDSVRTQSHRMNAAAHLVKNAQEAGPLLFLLLLVFIVSCLFSIVCSESLQLQKRPWVPSLSQNHHHRCRQSVQNLNSSHLIAKIMMTWTV